MDNMAIVEKDLKQVQGFKRDISRHLEITDLEELCYILGIQIKCNREAYTITLNQTTYIYKFLEHFERQVLNSISTPLNMHN